jgi:hypothetical protein
LFQLHLDTAASEEHAEEKANQAKNSQNLDFFEAHSESALSSGWQQDNQNQVSLDKKNKNDKSKYSDGEISKIPKN